MTDDLRRQLRALYEREFPAVHDQVASLDGLAADRLLLALFSELLEDPEEHEEVLALDPAAQRRWLVERAQEMVAPDPGGDAAAECVRPAAAGWAEDYFEGRLAPSAEPGLWRHLDDCAVCRARYVALRSDEGEGSAAVIRRRERLARGLPWSAVADSAPPEGLPDADEPVEAQEPAEGSASEHARAAAEYSDEEAPGLSSRTRWIIYGVAAALFVLGSVLLWTNPTGHLRPLRFEKPDPRALEVLPDQGLTVSLFRFDRRNREGTPWRLVQTAVGARDRLLVTYSLREGRGKFLTLASIDDRGRIRWLLPRVGEAGRHGSAPVKTPAAGVRLPREVRVSDGIGRIVVYAVVSAAPVPLADVSEALTGAFEQPGFATNPPLLVLDGTLQYNLALDVLQ